MVIIWFQVRSEEDMEEVFKRTIEKFGRLDILVNCAGFSAAYLTMTLKAETFRLETFSRMIDVMFLSKSIYHLFYL